MEHSGGPPSPDAFANEEARIREAYARRKESSFYSMADSAHRMAWAERERKLLAVLAQHGFTSLEHAKILDVGCGAGAWLRDFIRWGARLENLAGVDLLPERIAEARRLFPRNQFAMRQCHTPGVARLHIRSGSAVHGLHLHS